MNWNKHEILIGDVFDRLAELPAESVHCVVTSPPYWSLRDYSVDGQIGSEPTLREYIETMRRFGEAVRRVLRDDGVFWLNIGDTYANDDKWGGSAGQRHTAEQNGAGMRARRRSGLTGKNLCGVPWRVAFALQDAGWILRSDNIWAKPNPMPSSVQDRTVTAHEYVFMLVKQRRYFYDSFATREPAAEASIVRLSQDVEAQTGSDRANAGQKRVANMKAVGGETRLMRDVWNISVGQFFEAHFATFPLEIPLRCITASTSEYGCCASCGAQYVRKLKKERVRTRPGQKTKVKTPAGWDTSKGSAHGVEGWQGRAVPAIDKRTKQIAANQDEKPWNAEQVGNRDPGRHVTNVTHAGWRPGCKCEGEKVCAPVVLDPFAGAGTTLLAALMLCRESIGIELNQEYASIAERRIQKHKRPTTFVDETDGAELPLFEGIKSGKKKKRRSKKDRKKTIVPAASTFGDGGGA